MSSHENAVDCIYIAACAGDARLTRICVASIRYFYPEVVIKLLIGGALQRGLAKELQRYWNVGLARQPTGDYGWGFVKLEPLFMPPGERFLILDSDTIITGPVLQFAAHHHEDFIIDSEYQSPENEAAVYYDRAKSAEEGRPLPAADFLFNTGQWFGRSGLLNRDDFTDLIEWGWPPRLSNPRVFKNGEQGVLNYVVNQQYRARRITVARVPLMQWPGHGLCGLNARMLADGSAPMRVVHWAGLKNIFLVNMVGGDLLLFFENFYYTRLRAGRLRRILALGRHVWIHVHFAVTLRAKLFTRKWLGQPQSGMISSVVAKPNSGQEAVSQRQFMGMGVRDQRATSGRSQFERLNDE